MKPKAQRFDPRQNMQGDTFEVFHYLDIKTRHMEAHYHDFYEIFYFLDGEVDYWVDGTVYHLHSGDILLINPAELHKPIPLSDTLNYERIVLWINKAYLSGIENGIFEGCFDEKRLHNKKILRLSSLKKKEMLDLFYAFLREYNSTDFASDISSYALLLQILTEINRLSLEKGDNTGEKYRTPTFIADVLAYIGEHTSEELSLSRLSSHFFVSKYYLSHEFSKAVGTSIHRYIMLKRLNNAYDLLLDGVAAAEAAHRCGFSDYTAFYRAFKAEYSISPTAVRKQLNI